MSKSFGCWNKRLVTAALVASFSVAPLMASAATVKPVGRRLPVKKSVVRRLARPAVKKPAPVRAGKISNLPGKPVIYGPNPVINVPPLASPTAPIIPVPVARRYVKTVQSDKPIILAGDEILEIANAHYLQNQNIILKDRAQLIIKDSLFEQKSSVSLERYLEARDYSKITITNSDLRFSSGIKWRLTDHAVLTLRASSVAADATSGIVWHEVDKDASVNVYGSPFHGSVKDRAKIAIDRSADVFLDLDLNGAIVDEAFPRTVSEYIFPGYDDRNIYFKIALTNSSIFRWGVKLSPMSNVTIRDAAAMNIGMVFGWPLENATFALDGLQTGKFEDRTIAARQMKLRLINSTVSEWIPVVGDTNSVKFTNANLAAQEWDWGFANVTLENCVVPRVRTKQNVVMTLKDCAVNGDVTAIDDSKIILINTTVAGNQKTRGNGQIREQ